jgi:hypothetical protein
MTIARRAKIEEDVSNVCLKRDAAGLSKKDLSMLCVRVCSLRLSA